MVIQSFRRSWYYTGTRLTLGNTPLGQLAPNHVLSATLAETSRLAGWSEYATPMLLSLIYTIRWRRRGD